MLMAALAAALAAVAPHPPTTQLIFIPASGSESLHSLVPHCRLFLFVAFQRTENEGAQAVVQSWVCSTSWFISPKPLFVRRYLVSLSKQMHVHCWMHANHLDSRVGLSFNVNLSPLFSLPASKKPPSFIAY